MLGAFIRGNYKGWVSGLRGGLPGLRILGRGGLGVELAGVRLRFDQPYARDALLLISHAHLDHSPSKSSAVMTPETKSILSAIGRKGRWRTLAFGERLKVGEKVEVRPEPSGHVLGSSQFVVEGDGVKVVYTGDLNIYRSILHRGAEPLKADALIIESTYGIPIYIFPKREEVYADIVRWVVRVLGDGEVPAFRVYALGKSQEIISIINAYLDVPVVVSWPVARISEKYVEHGVKLDYMPLNSEEGLETLRQGECVYVSSAREVLPTRRRVRWAVATGWAVRYRYPSYDAAFPLSGHSDYPGLLNYVKQSEPKKIYTVHGYSEQFSRHLRRRGYDAKPLPTEGQTILQED